MNVRCSVKTDVGRKRKNNEDYYCKDESLGLFAVLDGLGGHRSGEVASRLAAERILQGIRDIKKFGVSALVGDYDDALSLEANQLASSIRLANQAIYQSASEHAEYKGMSCTVASALVLEGRVVTAHVGDSRIYLLQGNTIEQISEDHSFVQEQIQKGIITHEEASQSELKNIVTRALGANESVEISVDEFALLENDSLVLCTDGLTDMLSNEDILTTYLQNGRDPEATCTRLVDIANERGGRDNITVLLLTVHDTARKHRLSQLSTRLWKRK